MAKKLRFSIVIPLAPWRNAEILSSINKQEFAKSDYEIIIEKGLNVPDNRNRGAKKAKGEYVIFLDDDAVIKPDFLKNVDNFFRKNPEIDVLGGPQLTPNDEKLFARNSGYALSNALSGPGVVNKRYKKAALSLNASSSYITGANMTIRRKLFSKMKFDLSIYPGDDVAFVDKAKEEGYGVAYSPEVVIYHRRRPSVSGLVEQIFDYGRVRPQKNMVKQFFKTPLFFVPPVFMIYLLFLPVLLKVSPLFFIPLLVYLLMILITGFYEAIINLEILAIILVPFSFVVIHLSYGLGVFAGIFDRLIK